MAKDSQVKIEEGYIHITCEPGFEITRDAVLDQWKQVAAICKKTKLRKILVAADAPQRSMSVADAQMTGSFFEKEGISALSIAMCFTNYETDKLSDFFETVGYNRGIQIKFFNDRRTAIEWLTINKEEQAKPDEK
jgi:hypothetical protein